MRELSVAFVLLALSCGGRAESQGNAGTGGDSAAGAGSSDAAAGTPGVGPIDATGLPTQLVMACPAETAAPKLALPCQVGGSLTGGVEGPGSINVLECFDVAGKLAFSTTIPFGQLPMLLNQPLQVPVASLPQQPLEGENVALAGTLIVSHVDPVGRAFVAALVGGTARYVGPDGESVTCKIPDTPFWAVQGGFI